MGKRRGRGFTLIEMLIVVAILGILAAIAYPSYADHVLRGKISDGLSALSAAKVRMDQYFSNNRTYQGTNPPCAAGGLISRMSTQNFTLACSAVSPTTFTLQAAGIPQAGTAGFTYTIDQTGAKRTTGVSGRWNVSMPKNCWVLKKDGSCS